MDDEVPELPDAGAPDVPPPPPSAVGFMIPEEEEEDDDDWRFLLPSCTLYPKPDRCDDWDEEEEEFDEPCGAEDWRCDCIEGGGALLLLLPMLLLPLLLLLLLLLP